MTKRKYIGTGKSVHEAIDDLAAVAEKNDIGGSPTEIIYTCAIKVGRRFVKGKPNKDYDEAMKSAMEQAKVPEDRLDDHKLKIQAKGTYALPAEEGKQEAQPRPSGSCAENYSLPTLTDLV